MSYGVNLGIWVICVFRVLPVAGQSTERILDTDGNILSLNGMLLQAKPYESMGQVRLSANQTRMVFTTGGIYREVWAVNVDGTNLTPLTESDLTQDWDPYWSPDGMKIVFRRGFEEGAIPFKPGWHLYTMDADGSNVNPLTDLDGGTVRPAWSPDGTLIAFEWTNSGGPGDQIMTIKPDGTNLTQLTHLSGGAQRPAWSPNSRQVVFTGFETGATGVDLYLINRDGTDVMNLTNQPGSYGLPCWSPDGTRIAYTSERDGQWGLYSIRNDGSEEVFMINGFVLCMQWFSDGGATSIINESWGSIKQKAD